MALSLGPLDVDPPVLLAPMAGVTNPAFRQLCREFGPALYVSEMITARALVERNARTMRMAARAPGEAVHSVQLYGVDPVTVKRAVAVLVDEVGVDHLDMNFGCPAPKVTRRGGGAALPAHPNLLRSIIAAAVGAAGRVPVTIKMRIGIDDRTVTFLEAGRIAEGEGAAAVILHARTAEQRYAPSARWDAIADLKRTVTSIPVLGNGDIFDPAHAVAMMARTGCDGVVVGRGCLGRPWLFADLAEALRPASAGARATAGSATPPAHPDRPATPAHPDRPATPAHPDRPATPAHPDRPATPAHPDRAGFARHPNLAEVAQVMVRHARLLVDYAGPAGALRDFRKHTGWYLTGFPVGPAVRAALANVDTLGELEELLGRLDGELTRSRQDAARPGGHHDGPRPVALPQRWLDDPDDPTPPVDADDLVSGG